MEKHTVSRKQRDEIQKGIADVLKDGGDIMFAYLHGSFLEGAFQDIDVAVYLPRTTGKRDALKYELRLERELKENTGFPVDVRILNYAPLSFRFNVIKNGVLLFSKNEETRCDFENLIDFYPFDLLRDSH